MDLLYVVDRMYFILLIVRVILFSQLFSPTKSRPKDGLDLKLAKKKKLDPYEQ